MKPGSSFLYNPVVFGRLSNWVEENTERSYRDWMYQYVIDPGGLDSLAAGWRDPGKGIALTQLAPPFRFDPDDNDGIAPSVLPNPELNASSGVIASVLDLARYSIALDEGRILPAELRERMWTPPVDPDGSPAPYAYGWYVQKLAGSSARLARGLVAGCVCRNAPQGTRRRRRANRAGQYGRPALGQMR